MAQDPAVRQGHDDGVHQMRVAARRLRSALKTFGPLVDETWAREHHLYWYQEMMAEKQERLAAAGIAPTAHAAD